MAASVATEKREREQLMAAVEMHEKRTGEMVEMVDGIEEELAAMSDLDDEASQAALPSWLKDYEARVLRDSALEVSA